ncbi:MAG: MFS transporter [Dehalococcoidia bacterium]
MTTASSRHGFFYGWWVLAGSVVAVALGSGVSFWSFGLYVDPLETEFGWSRAEVTGGFSVSLLISGLSGPLVGRWADVSGPRRVILVGAVLTAVTYLLLAFVDSLWQWYLFLSINAFFRQFILFIPFQAIVSRWFDRKRGLAVGILGTGFSAGGFVVVPLMRVVIDEFGWAGSFIFSAIITAAYFIPFAVLFLRNSPADVNTYPDGIQPAATSGPYTPPAMTGMTLAQATRTPFFWLISLALMFFFFGMFGMLVHLVPLYESIGVARSTAANLVAIAAGLGMIARLSMGLIADRIDRMERGAMGLILMLIGATAALLVDSGTAGIGFFIALWVIGSGGGPLLEPLLLPRAFGLSHFGAILGTVGVVETFGLIASPFIAGVIYDETGSYDLVLVMLIGAFSMAFVLFGIASRMKLPIESREPVSAQA